MRLIDADDLRRVFDECVWNDAVLEVDEAPTAYDVKAVIGELFHSAHDMWGLNIIKLEDAMEIVKRGGVRK